jgi:hypothetical protein
MALHTTRKSNYLLPLRIRQTLHWRASRHLSDHDVALIIGAVADYLDDRCKAQVPDFSTQAAAVVDLRMQAKAAVK